MKFRSLFSLIILISTGVLCSCSDDAIGSTEEIVKTAPEARIEIDPYQGYFELDTSFTVTSFSYDKNTSETDLKFNWFTNNELCEMCELEEYVNLNRFNIKFENSDIDKDKKIDLILFVTNGFGLRDSIKHTILFENETPIIDFKISPTDKYATFTFDLSNSTDAFGGKDLYLKLDINDNGLWNYEKAYESDSSFIIIAGGFSRNATTKIKAQIEDSQGNKVTETKSIRLEHGIITIN